MKCAVVYLMTGASIPINFFTSFKAVEHADQGVTEDRKNERLQMAYYACTSMTLVLGQDTLVA